MSEEKKVLIPQRLLEQLVYYLNTRDDPRAWELADELQIKLDKVIARQLYGKRLQEAREKTIDDWLAATEAKLDADLWGNEKEGE